jgi:cytochrome c oxidase subunit II
VRAALLLCATLVLLGACSGRQTMLDPAGEQAQEIDVVWRVMLVVCGFMYALVLIFLLWALVRARRPLGDLAPRTGHTANERALERGLGAWIALIVLGLAGLTATSFLIDAALARNDPGPLRIRVTANQWWWAVEYPGSTPDQTIRTANELHLPVNRPALIELRANDVIHSLWIPNLAGKRDLIPGRFNTLVITPRREGVYRAQCAEFCGLEHAYMALDVHVHSSESFQAWQEHARAPAEAVTTAVEATGREIFIRNACALCHTIAGTGAQGVTGPDLTHFAARRTIAGGVLPNTPDALADWIENPQAFKPGVNMPAVTMSANERAALAAYLGSLE